MTESALDTNNMAKPKGRRGRQKKTAPVTTPEILSRRLLLRVSEYCQLTGVAPATAYSLIKKGEIETVTIGSGIRIPAASVKSLVA